MRQLALSLFLGLILAGCYSGCSTVDEGHDPVVVNAERVRRSATKSVDKFLAWERKWHVVIKDEGIKRFANELRDQYPIWERDLRGATAVYKLTRSQADKTKLDAALQVLRFAMETAEAHLASNPGLR